ncbi:MAG: PBP1A family penicillin-binding protein [Herminiimonas sp.]|nr:PBP1A family penicillin-binding protein [Herminiimonas sp.]
MVVTGVVSLLLYALLLIPFTPSIADLRKAKAEKPSVVISVDGQRLAVFKRSNREWVPLSRIAPQVVQALVATEDNRFYEHHGVDFYRLGGAALRTLTGHLQGGSTITQQLARNLYPEEIGRSRSLGRKIKETITAFKIEHAFTKKEILETYLNTVPFLYNAFGIEMAARTYFDKSAATLSIAESATLIGMLKGASYYNPVFNAERAIARRNVVLSQMVRRGVLAPATYEAIKRRPIRLDFERQLEARGTAPHFAEYLRKWLVSWADQHDYNIYSDGLKIYTTIDARLQVAANQAVKRRLNSLQAVADVEWGIPGERLFGTSTAVYVGMHSRVPPFAHFWRANPALTDTFVRESAPYRTAVAAGAEPAAALAQVRQDSDFMAQLKVTKSRIEAGFLALDPTTGDIKAWVGSRDFDTGQFDHVARAQRQPGSTFKPFVYGAALEAGMSPEKTFMDQVIDYRFKDGSVWRPQDIGAATNQPMTATQGLVYSKNTITAQVMQDVGPAKVVDFARRAGVRQSRLNAVPSLALGTSPATLLEMAAGYATIANGGQYNAPQMVTRIEDSHGRVLVEFASRSVRAMSRGTAEDLLQMMRGVVSQGSGQALRTQFGIQGEVAGKTGTTQDNTDGWFIMMHPRLVAGAWVGFDDPRVTMRSTYWGQGAHNALPVVGDFFAQAVNRRMIDIDAHFPRARDAWFGAEFWGPPLDWLETMFGKSASSRLQSPAPRHPPPPQRQPLEQAPQPGRVPPATDFEQAIEDVRRTGRQVQDEVDRVSNVLDAVRRLFN